MSQVADSLPMATKEEAHKMWAQVALTGLQGGVVLEGEMQVPWAVTQ